MMKTEDFSDIAQSKLMPGQMLKIAREAQNMTLETVSKYLHLTIPTILSIEEDHYQKMPAPVYVRGYLRRYAQFVKLCPEEVLKAFEQNVEVKSKILEEVPSYVRRKPITSSHIGIRFLTYGIAVLLLILVGLWWKGHDRIEKNPAIPGELRIQPYSTPLKVEPTTPSLHPTEPVQIEPKKESSIEIEANSSQNLQTKRNQTSKDENPALEKITNRVNGAEAEVKEKNIIRPTRQQPKHLDLY